MATVCKRASAKRDLVGDYVYLAEHDGIETAERFLSNADDCNQKYSAAVQFRELGERVLVSFRFGAGDWARSPWTR